MRSDQIGLDQDIYNFKLARRNTIQYHKNQFNQIYHEIIY